MQKNLLEWRETGLKIPTIYMFLMFLEINDQNTN